MPDHREIYARHARRYDALVTREDHEGNLLKSLAEKVPLDGARVVEFGAGTGRLTAMLAPKVETIHAHDASSAMLDVARAKLEALETDNWWLAVADNRSLPLPSGRADLSIEGWSFGHATKWNPDGWRADVSAMVAEMSRVLRPGGMSVVIESLGTNVTEASAPTPALEEFYQTLETDGFERTVVSTDYLFESVDQAVELMGFFFGDAMGASVRAQNSPRVTEFTGLWTRRRSAK